MYINLSLLQQENTIKIQRDNVLLKNKRIKQQNEDIKSSIENAKRIQTTLLPTNQKLKKYLKKYFLIYKPLNIVSGDFYWIAKIKNKIILVVADCTGHGVPGAFTSILGISFLDQIIIKDKITTPNIILERLRKMIISSMSLLNDGMDICLISIDEKTLNLEYAGANNSCLIVRNNSLIELKADSMYIGKEIESINNKFTNYTFQLEKNDCIYCYTDGFIDQFGGQNQKKLKSKNFKNLLVETSNSNIEHQEIYFNDFLSYWQGNLKQTDDITLIGIKI